MENPHKPPPHPPSPKEEEKITTLLEEIRQAEKTLASTNPKKPTLTPNLKEWEKKFQAAEETLTTLTTSTKVEAIVKKLKQDLEEHEETLSDAGFGYNMKNKILDMITQTGIELGMSEDLAKQLTLGFKIETPEEPKEYDDYGEPSLTRGSVFIDGRRLLKYSSHHDGYGFSYGGWDLYDEGEINTYPLELIAQALVKKSKTLEVAKEEPHPPPPRETSPPHTLTHKEGILLLEEFLKEQQRDNQTLQQNPSQETKAEIHTRCLAQNSLAQHIQTCLPTLKPLTETLLKETERLRELSQPKKDKNHTSPSNPNQKSQGEPPLS